MVQINYNGLGPHGNWLYWTEVGPAKSIVTSAKARAKTLGVQNFSAEREHSSKLDWDKVFDPDKVEQR